MTLPHGAPSSQLSHTTSRGRNVAWAWHIHLVGRNHHEPPTPHAWPSLDWHPSVRPHWRLRAECGLYPLKGMNLARAQEKINTTNPKSKIMGLSMESFPNGGGSLCPHHHHPVILHWLTVLSERTVFTSWPSCHRLAQELLLLSCSLFQDPSCPVGTASTTHRIITTPFWGCALQMQIKFTAGRQPRFHLFLAHFRLKRYRDQETWPEPEGIICRKCSIWRSQAEQDGALL